jgi:hypothetical protein
VFNAYSESKAIAYNEMQKNNFFGTLPWKAQEIEETQQLIGKTSGLTALTTVGKHLKHYADILTSKVSPAGA